MSEFEFDMDRVLAACTHGPEFRGICAACTRAAVLAEVRGIVDQKLAVVNSLFDSRKQPGADIALMARMNQLQEIRDLFAPGGPLCGKGGE